MKVLIKSIKQMILMIIHHNKIKEEILTTKINSKHSKSQMNNL
jgi:hypothetical protein